MVCIWVSESVHVKTKEKSYKSSLKHAPNIKNLLFVYLFVSYGFEKLLHHFQKKNLCRGVTIK